MIRLKQLIEQVSVNPLGKKIAKDTFKNIEKTKKWEPIVGQFSKQFKSIITRPEQLISITSNPGKNLLSGFTQSNGTLQNGGTKIEYLKTPKVFKDKSETSETIFKLILQPNYVSKYNPNHFAIDGYIVMKGVRGEISQDVDVSSDKAKSLKLPFYIGLYKNKSGQLTYAIAPGKSSIQRSGLKLGGSDYTMSATTPQLQRVGNLSSVDELVRKLETMLYDAMDRNKVLRVILPMTSDWNPPQPGLF